MTDNVDAFLAHYGVKGMQWGKTRGVNSRGNEHSIDVLKKRLKRSADEFVDGINPTKIGQNRSANYSVSDLKRGVKSSVNYTVKGARGAGRKAAAGARGAVKKSKAKRAAVKAERKANSEAANKAGYSSRQRSKDLQDVGRKGVRKIEKRVAGGEKVNTARFKVQVATTARGLAVGSAILAGPVALAIANKGAGDLASHINTKRGAEAARNLLADNRGLTSYATVALTFDKVKGSYKL